MPKAKAKESFGVSSRKFRPALSPESREKQMCSLAMDCAEEQMRNGTASSQVITHFLKLASSKYEKEIEKLEKENELLRAKTEAIESASSSEEMYRNALHAFAKYSGHGDEYQDEEEY